MPDSIIGKVSVGDGATFTPSVNSAGELSWTNNKNLPNPATVDLAQAVINSGAGIFLPLTGGTVTGSVEVTGGVTADVTGNVTGDVTGNADTATNATNATNDSNGNKIDTTYLPLSGGTLTGEVNGVTPTAGDNSTKIATTEFVNTKAGNYLPLSGGTITGSITMGTEYIKRSVDNASLTVCGGTSYSNGAYMSLNGKDRSINAGIFVITAEGGAESRNLVGKPDGTLTWDNQPLLPVGIVQAFAGTTIPNGWLLCDGSAVSRTTYANLYACIGTTYGAGDGSSTFNLPNLVDKFVEGSATAGTEKSAGLPNITADMGNLYLDRIVHSANGSFYFTNNYNSVTGWQDDNGYSDNFATTLAFDASRSSSIYGNSTTVQPPSVTMRYIIKY